MRWALRAILWLVVALPVVPVTAQGMLFPDQIHAERVAPVPPGTLPLSLNREKVTVEIHELAATTLVEQAFHNDLPHRIEGTFLFALPEAAAVTNFAMTVNGQEVGGELLDAKEARQVYQEIVRRQRDPGLLEYLGRDLFRARIFPIEPGEKKVIKLEYTQAIPVENGLARFVFPLRSKAYQPRGPIVRPMPGPMVRDGRPQPDGLPPGHSGRIGSLALSLKIDSQIGIKSVYSPTHDIDVIRDGAHKVKLGFEESDVVPAEDFLLYFQLSDAMFGLNLLTHRGAGEQEGTFMLLIAPKSEVREQEIKAKDIVFVFDTSGSMNGPKIEQAKSALKYCLNNLNPGDRFNVVAFSTDLNPYEDRLVVATKEAVDEALKFVDGLKARGSTNIDQALRSGFGQLPEDDPRPGMVLFLTDGLPTVGERRIPRLLEIANDVDKSNSRLFGFGVGNDVNTTLLDQLSLDHHGTRTYVKPDEDIEVAVSTLYDKIASPVMSDLRLEVDGVKLSELHPVTLPDLFRGSQLTILGRYEGSGKASIKLHGKLTEGEQTFDYSVAFPERERENGFLPRLWATRRVGYLLEQMRLNGEDKESKDEVIRLATRYGILTPYTSYLVLEPGMAVPERLRARMDGAGGVPAATAPGMPGRPGPAGPRGNKADDVGAGAVARSEAQQSMQQADRVEAPVAPVVQNAGGRAFYLKDNVWVDSLWPADEAGQTVLKVKYGSDAYFDLLGVRDDLKDILALGTSIKATVGKVLLVIGDEGAEQLTKDIREALKP